jgi:hypothetical protein
MQLLAFHPALAAVRLAASPQAINLMLFLGVRDHRSNVRPRLHQRIDHSLTGSRIFYYTHLKHLKMLSAQTIMVEESRLRDSLHCMKIPVTTITAGSYR